MTATLVVGQVEGWRVPRSMLHTVGAAQSLIRVGAHAKDETRVLSEQDVQILGEDTDAVVIARGSGLGEGVFVAAPLSEFGPAPGDWPPVWVPNPEAESRLAP